MAPEIAEATLLVGRFLKAADGGWRRLVEEEQASIAAYATREGLLLSISPPVSSLAGHANKRIAASVMYEIAARYAEKVDGTIQQEGINVAACQLEGQGGAARVLAAYPESRLDFRQLCVGWRSVFLGEQA